MLLRADVDEIHQYLRSLEKDRKQIEKQIATVAFYMQGGLSYMDGYNLPLENLSMMMEVISEHYDKVNNMMNNRSKNR